MGSSRSNTQGNRREAIATITPRTPMTIWNMAEFLKSTITQTARRIGCTSKPDPRGPRAAYFYSIVRYRHRCNARCCPCGPRSGRQAPRRPRARPASRQSGAGEHRRPAGRPVARPRAGRAVPAAKAASPSERRTTSTACRRSDLPSTPSPSGASPIAAGVRIACASSNIASSAAFSIGTRASARL